MQDLEEPVSGDTGTLQPGSQGLIFESLIRHYHSKIFQGSGLRNQQRMTRRAKVESTTDATPGLSVAKPLSANLADDARYECRLVRINLHAVLLVDTKDNLNTFPHEDKITSTTDTPVHMRIIRILGHAAQHPVVICSITNRCRWPREGGQGCTPV